MSAGLTDAHRPPPLPVNEYIVISLVEDCLSIVSSKTQAPTMVKIGCYVTNGVILTSESSGHP